jgi:glucuronoarabinoxylan endo-1,4-beta-xylanase
LDVFDVLGKQVASLVNSKQAAGDYSVLFDASNLSSGVYFYRLQAGSFVQTKKMLFIK